MGLVLPGPFRGGRAGSDVGMCSVVSIRSAYHYGQMSVREPGSNLVMLVLAVLSKRSRHGCQYE